MTCAMLWLLDRLALFGRRLAGEALYGDLTQRHSAKSRIVAGRIEPSMSEGHRVRP